MAFKFHPVELKSWTGPYGRIPGDSNAFHLRTHPRKGRPWLMTVLTQDADQGSCWAVDGPAIHELAAAVIKAKRFLGGGGGGEFLINEFGQVLVPSPNGDGKRAYAGRIEGSLRFEDPFSSGGVFDLSDDTDLQCGARWRLPYVGCQYNLAAGGWIYTSLDTKDGTTYPRLTCDGQYLIQSLRQIRSSGAVRFIVNPCGLVLTKRQDGAQWHPAYVGRLRPGGWFQTDGGVGLNLAPQPVVGGRRGR